MHNYITQIVQKANDIVKQLNLDMSANQKHPLHTVTCRQTNLFKQKLSENQFHVIAEIKRHSPSKGALAKINDPTELAKQYVIGCASAISVLTNEVGFNGSIEDMSQVIDAVKSSNTQVLRKDFIVDKVQIAQSVLYGANAVLLIVAVTKQKTKELLETCKQYNIDAIVEVHTKEELDYALSIGAEIIGVNNRNLTTFEVDTNTAIKLKQFIPDNIISIAESGISTVELAKQYRSIGYNAVLIGEALVKSSNPAKMIQEITQ